MIKLIACDLDRTLLPNGHEANDGGLLAFSKFVEKRDFVLAYVSGRNWKLFEEARSEFPLPLPDYFFGDVGTVLYKKEKNADTMMITDDSWFSYIKENTPHWDWQALKMLTQNPRARPQEDWRQNDFKLSYYVDDLHKGQDVAREIREKITSKNISADVIYSIDPLKNVGLIDILPSVATKVTAVEFLCKQFDLTKDEVVYCGDSGNDILPLTHGYKSVLVANASPEIQGEVRAKTVNAENLYIAKGVGTLNGNYAGGVLEGLVHFNVLSENTLQKILRT